VSSPNHCPSCNIEWEEKQTITEHFVNEGYTLSKAVQTGAMYGCTPNTPQHFGVNVVVFVHSMHSTQLKRKMTENN